MAFSQFQTAVASALNFAFTALNVEQRFTWLFGSFAIAAWITGIAFFATWVAPFPFGSLLVIDCWMIRFHDLDQQETELNQIGKGERAGFIDEDPDMNKTSAEKATGV